MTNDEICEARRSTDAQRRRELHAMTPTQRMEVAAELQRSAWKMLQSNPVAMQAFVARNHHQRRQSNAVKLLREMMGKASQRDECE